MSDINVIIEPINYKVQVSNFPVSNSNNVNVNTGDLTGSFAQLYADNTLTGINTFNNPIIVSGIDPTYPSLIQIIDSLDDGGSGASLQLVDNGDGGLIYDCSGSALIGYFNFGSFRGLFDENFIQAVEFDNEGRYLYNNNGTIVFDFNQCLLYDESQTLSLDGINRYLYDNSNNISIDWQNRILSGNWNFPQPNTGELTGVFYPLNSNPSGYITGFDTGNLVDLYSYQTISGLKDFAGGVLAAYIQADSNYGFPIGMIDQNNLPSVDWNGRALLDDSINEYLALTWFSTHRMLWAQPNKYPTGAFSLDWQNRYLYDSTSFPSVPNSILTGISLIWDTGVSGRKMYDVNTKPTLDWQNRILTGGSWTIQSGTFVGDISFTNVPSGTPTNVVTPADWMPVFVSGQKYFIPLYQ